MRGSRLRYRRHSTDVAAGGVRTCRVDVKVSRGRTAPSSRGLRQTIAAENVVTVVRERHPVL